MRHRGFKLLLFGWIAVHLCVALVLPPMPRLVRSADVPVTPELTPDGGRLLCADQLTLTVWDTRSGRSWQWPWPPGGRVPGLRDYMGGTLAACADPPGLWHMDIDTGERTLIPDSAHADPLALTEDWRWVAYRTRTGAVAVWDIRNRRSWPVPVVDGEVESAGLTWDGSRVAVQVKVAEARRQLRLLDRESGLEVWRVVDEGEPAWIGFSPDGRVIVEYGKEGRPPTVLRDASHGRVRGGVPWSESVWWAGKHLITNEFSSHVSRVHDDSGRESSAYDTNEWQRIDPSQRHVQHTTFLPDGRIGFLRFGASASGLDRPSEWLPRPLWPLIEGSSSLLIYDPATGNFDAEIPISRVGMGILVATARDTAAVCLEGRLTFWDIPPRKPWGWFLIVLGLQLSVYLAWRRRPWRRR